MDSISNTEFVTPARVLFTFVFAAQFLTGIYSALAVEMPTLFVVLYPVASTWLVWWWLDEDSKLSGESWPIDLGLFLFFAWPVIVPYYLVKTRGIGGLKGVVAFIGTLALAWTAALIVSVLLWH